MVNAFRQVQYNQCPTAYTTTGGGNNGSCNVKYLLQKIGMGAKPTDEGLCRAVLDKCQRYTYDSRGKYDPYNDIILNYVQRAMVNIASGQHKIISDYASSCMVEVATCYNQQVSQVNAWSSAASADSVYKVMRGACRNVALTCAYGVFAEDPASCPVDDPDTTGDEGDPDDCINSISEMFYQSLLCPENSTHKLAAPLNQPKDQPSTYMGWVNAKCKCDAGFVVWGNSCYKQCVADQYRNASGSCTACPSGKHTGSVGMTEGRINEKTSSTDCQ
jgi:hypothetical protein